MQVHRSLNDLPRFRNAVLTIGTFDGVHEGHQRIISALQQEAKQIGGETLIVTFHPHPRKVVNPDEQLQLINTLGEKTTLMDKAGIDHLVIAPFTAEFSELSADAYVSEFLVKNFQPAVIIIGYDHHFGKGRRGNYQLLAAKQAECGYRLMEIPKQVLDEVTVSSTKIRLALKEGRVADANKLLGYDFFFSGTVVAGDKIGRTLGYPTANLEHTDPDKIRLGYGVYAVTAAVKGSEYKGMMSVGNRPTLVNSDEKVEVHLFDFEESIYGETMKVTVKHFLRGQEKYPSLEAMVQQLHRDKETSLSLL